jgi:hypothetical protein
MATARISRAIAGYQIPLLSIPRLYKVLEEAILAGKSNGDLRDIVAAFPGVEAT